ncbi:MULTISPECIES: RNA polymerase subunit sigma-70 [unclassified Amycolatopsis]|uniref:RNA polymerase subunit sigma-70 n=1 Tax=unclassified Amycolatopsis TaxID=2618356 RepID=UPI002877067B|nr:MULTISPECIES: RNA polymerase subunit sigma-70 [unclassified Amycolatopsis]MDS0136542.1 RNA polymerase subunit sigma-70 [Amycolatopsis sp. 505]MDS0143206.1 RNA polymerase subunit sigma-70 [Amycolatopsis sp. CM201R]
MGQDFETLVERHRREIQVHCYRMLGSLADAEDLTQETFLRAWKARDGFEGRASVRTWLYRIATNACLDVLARRPRRVLPDQLGPAGEPDGPIAAADLPWLEPYPDRLLDGAGPDDAVVDRETIELAYLAAVQYLPPRQRAALILRDVLGWSAKETAASLETSVASANSALQRARATLRERLPPRRTEWTVGDPTAEEAALLKRFIAAYEAGDVSAVARLLHEDAQAIMPPYTLWFGNRASIVRALSFSLDPASPDCVGRFRMRPVRANRQPAVATYLKRQGEHDHRWFGVTLFTVEAGSITAMAAFESATAAAWGLPETWRDDPGPAGKMQSGA